MINRVVLVGRLTRNPELRKVSSTGNSVCSFSIAVDNPRKNADGTRGTMFLNCSVFGVQAENTAKFIRKGNMVGVDGSLNQREFTRNDGTKATVIEVLVTSVTFLEPKSANANNDIEQTNVDSGFNDIQAEETSTNLSSIDLPDDDLPF